jgi:hypothetical protein
MLSPSALRCETKSTSPSQIGELEACCFTRRELPRVILLLVCSKVKLIAEQVRERRSEMLLVIRVSLPKTINNTI